MILTANSQTFQPDLKRIPQVLTIGIEDSAKINMLYSAAFSFGQYGIVSEYGGTGHLYCRWRYLRYGVRGSDGF